ncbi:hypothetical protein EVC37_21760 [Methylocaldum sp. BRCS4]|uniref:hypothetical protein n=1 Tax=Methylocaldum sp. GT1BW TaxID=3438964 RepID=UPI0012ECB18D|nr:hypothetical protein [Methylocaldum sp. BRCS4]
MSHKSTKAPIHPTEDQLNALKRWADKHGRTWKSKLRDAWISGDYGLFEDAPFLQQLRNQFGPTWLNRFKLT